VCVSSQAGCAMGCTFCATGQAGFTRHLSAGEVLEQVMFAARAAAPRRLSNVVFMGMGEPLANYLVTMDVVQRLHEYRGLSHVTSRCRPSVWRPRSNAWPRPASRSPSPSASTRRTTSRAAN